MEEDERRKICELIERWNGSRLDMFAISCPDENMEFHGVIRFFLHEQQQQQSPATGTAATKCMRVSSAHSVACVVHALVAKFHADMRMLAPASAYALWELHNDDNGAVAEQQQQRRMDAGERPLLVQLGWCCCTDEQGSGGGGMREGRFVLRRADAPETPPVVQSPPADFVRCIPRRFSKRRQAQAVPATTTTSALVGGSVKSVGGGKKRLQLRNNEIGTPRHLYDTVPPASSSPPPLPLSFSPNELTPFARTLSNPELVLKRRREQKLDEQLRHMGNSGSLKIYGVELFPQRPYVTLLVNATDSAKRVVRAALDKYGLEQADSSNYALAEVFLMESDAMSRSFSDLRSIEKQRERLLYASERPLQLLAEHSTSNNVVFFLRCRPSTPAMSGSSYTLDRLFPSLHRNNDELVAAHPNHHHHHHQQKGRHVDDDADVDDHDRLMRRMVNDGVVVSAGGKQTVAAAAAAAAAQFPSSSLPLLLPCLVPINAFASTANFGAGAVAIQPGVTEIGSSSACAIQLRAPSVLPRHCALHYRPNSSSVENNSQQQLEQQQQEAEDVPEREGEVIVSLLDKSALVELDGASTHADVRLQNGVQLRIGGVYCYRFFSNNSNNNSGGVDHGECAPPATDHIAEHDGTGMSQHRMQKEKLPSSSASVSFSSGPFNSATTVVHCIDPQHHQQQSEAALIVQNIFSPSVSFEQSNSNEYVELYKSSPLVGTPSSTTATPTSVAEQEQMLSLMPSAQQQKQQALQHNQTHHMHNQFHNNHDSSMRSPYKLPSSSPSSTSILPVYQHQQQQLPPRSAATLPILIECTDWRSEVELFKSELFATTNNNNNNNMATTTGSSTVGQQFGAFRLTPAFVLYAICRHRLHVSQSAAYDEERCRRLVGNTFAMFIDNCSRTIKVNHASRETLVFWLSNASELLNMGRTDAWLARAVGTALLDELAHVVQQLFTLLVEHCGQQLLGQGIQPIVQQWMLLLLRNRGAAGAPATATAAQQDGVPSLLVVAALDECLRTVRWALLNPALTIQLFSQLFHFISTTVFNWLVTEPEARPLICQQFGLLELKQLLDHVQQWAEQQGLELAAECHMDRLCQVVHLLCTPKNLQQVAVLGATCYRLNSVQVRFLLENYVGDVHAGETPAVSRELIEHVVALARQQQADDHHQQPSADGSMASSSAPQLTESTTLQLPFLLPHDGYVVEKLRGIPPDMATFVNALQQKGLVRVFVHQQQQAAASPSPLRHGAVPAEMPLSSWNVHMRHQQPSSSSSASAQCLPGKRSASITPSSSAFPTVVAPGAVAVGAAGAVTMFPPTPTPPPHQQRQLFNNGSSSSVAAGDSPVYAEIRRHNGGFQQHPQQQHPLAPPPPIRCQSASVFGTHHNTTNNNNGSNNNNQQQQQLQKKKKSNGYPNQQQHQQQQHQWNERLIDAEGVQQLLVERITLCRPSGKSGGGGIGLSIVEVGTPEHGSGIYVKNVIEGSPADVDGRLAPGDQLLSVNGQSLIGVGQDLAAKKIVSAGPVVHFEVAKQAAQANGLGPYFQQQKHHQNGAGSTTTTTPQQQNGHGDGGVHQQNGHGGGGVHQQNGHGGGGVHQQNGHGGGGVHQQNGHGGGGVHHHYSQSKQQQQTAAVALRASIRNSNSSNLRASKSQQLMMNSSNNGGDGGGTGVPLLSVHPVVQQQQKQQRSLSASELGSRAENNNNMTSAAASKFKPGGHGHPHHPPGAVIVPPPPPPSSTASSSSPLPLVHHSQQSSTSSSSRLPAHYRPSVSRPQVVVMQPARPSAATSPLSVVALQQQQQHHHHPFNTSVISNSNSSISTTVADPSSLKSLMMMMATDQHQNMKHTQQQLVDYSHLPLITAAVTTTASSGSPPINSSTTNSTASSTTTTLEDRESSNNFINSSYGWGDQLGQLNKMPPSAALADEREEKLLHTTTKLVKSGRSSAPLFGEQYLQQIQHVPAVVQQRDQQSQSSQQSNNNNCSKQKSSSTMNATMTAEEVERELDQLDSIVVSAQQQADNIDDDRTGESSEQQEQDHRYRLLLERLATVRGSAASAPTTTTIMPEATMPAASNNGTGSGNINNKLPASMVAAAQHLERQSKSLAALSLDPGTKTSTTTASGAGWLTPSASSTGNLLKIKRVTNSQISEIINPHHQIGPNPSPPAPTAAAASVVAELQSRNRLQQQPPAVPAKPAIRELLQRQSPGASSVAASATVTAVSTAKKRVQFSIQNNENILLEVPTDTDEDGIKSTAPPPSAEEEEDDEPRVQIVGAHEVYVNDPRQRRLQELQANQQKKVLIRPVTDSSSWGFREKMRIFAEQLGEREPSAEAYNQHKSSSAERRIVQQQQQPQMHGGDGEKIKQ